MKTLKLTVEVFLVAVTVTHFCGASVTAQLLPDLASSVASSQPDGPGWADDISAGGIHTCALTPSGQAKCWGGNGGQLGDGTIRWRTTPTDVITMGMGVASISSGRSHTCAISTSGGVSCWGWNKFGQLGDGTTVDRLIPVAVVGLTSGVRAISTGDLHTCALTQDGAVKCWGHNAEGELGDGTTTQRLTPTDVMDLGAGIRAVAAGSEHTCAITSSGSVKCWGQNRAGQLGNGSTVGSATPVDVSGLADPVRAIAASYFRTCALTEARGMKCWGNNASGALGDDTQIGRLTPVDVVGLTKDVQAISLGYFHTCALTTSGGVKCWGYNEDGRLGDSTTDVRLTPVDVVGLTMGVQALSAGGWHTCVMLTGGAVQCWGWNKYGQLGDGTTSDRLTPTAVVLELPYDCTAVSELPQNECQALATLFRATNGPFWRERAGWLRTVTPCSWYGVTCAAGHVSALDLPANNLADILPAALGDLPALQRLDLHGNDLDGPLPAALGNLTALQYLDLSTNVFSGSLPLTLGNLAALQHLDLSANTFSGTIPGELGKLAALRYLSLRANNLQGRLPLTLGKLAALEHLDLSQNQLADNLDDWPSYYAEAVAQLTALRYLDLSYNQLWGPLPWWPELAALEHLDLSHNAFVGALPWDVAGLTHLTYLALHTNHLSSRIPPTWGQLGAQRVFTPTGTTPPPGVYIDLSGNHLYGAIPAELGQNPVLQGLQLAGNALSGPVPAAVTDRDYYFLDLNYNQLTVDPGWRSAWDETQAVAPTQLRVEATDSELYLTWTTIWPPSPYGGWADFGEEGYYEISYASAPAGPFSVFGRRNVDDPSGYPLTDLAPGTYYFRLRTFIAAHSFYNYGSGRTLPVFKHDYFQPNNLWSDYTPLVSVMVGGPATPTATAEPSVTPTGTPGSAARIFLPLVLDEGR